MSWTTSAQTQKEDELARQIEQLVKAEQDAAAAYNPDEVVSLITQFYELLVTMGHYPEGSIRYPPHTDPPVNEELAAQLGYPAAAISLMRRLPVFGQKIQHRHTTHEILPRTRFADYTAKKTLERAAVLAHTHRDGWNIMLDTQLGVVRAYSTEARMQEGIVEWRRHGHVPDSEFERDEATKTEYRRAPLVPAAHYFSELIYAYRSLKRLPVISADRSEPHREGHASSYSEWA
ncbi:hypothetical protein B0H14DRAFT_3888053 [Mycena olivaceomarginata]|nr:hypothetical protein B0H14DRAFT_3888053 [Mycena olivaceomarginata]